MGSQPLPLSPAPLTVEQAEAMSQRRIKKHHVAIMLLHWFNAIVWLCELATGAALIASPYFRLMPYWYIDLMENLFGSRATMLQFHIAVGITWVIVFLVYGIFGFRTYLAKQIFEKEIALDRDDINWLIIRALRILKKSDKPLPPQDSYNAGQKLFALLVYAMIPVIMITGLIMAFHLFGTAVVGWAVVLHFVAVGLVVSGLVIHVYMGAVFPEEKAAFFSMLTGMVSELYAYRHHFKWWKEVKMQEEAWIHQLQGSSGSGGIAPPVAGAGPAATLPARVETKENRSSPWTFKRIFRAPEYWPPYVAGAGLRKV